MGTRYPGTWVAGTCGLGTSNPGTCVVWTRYLRTRIVVDMLPGYMGCGGYVTRVPLLWGHDTRVPGLWWTCYQGTWLLGVTLPGVWVVKVIYTSTCTWLVGTCNQVN